MPQILIVDDEFMLREVLSDVLREEGYEVATARHGAEALELLARGQPDLVLLDVMMPRLGGLETLRQMRARPDWASIPVILMSAGWQGLPKDVESAVFLRKPFDLDVLLSEINRLLSLSRG